MNPMKRDLIYLLIFTVGLWLPAHGQQELVLKAGKAYATGSYSIAAEQYKKVVESGYESPELYYNLGNSYFKMNDYPNAILWYERAKRLDPGNENINFNLNVVNTKISDKIEPLPVMFYKRWINNLVLLFSSDTWAGLAVWLLIAALGCLVIYAISRVLLLRKIGFIAALFLGFFTLFTLLMAWSGYSYTQSNKEAIVFAPTITVKSSPDDKGTDLFVLHEGTKVKLLDNISGWYEIRIANGSVGWLPQSSLEKI
jgi:tetratricopeptide (TPR) repeat protein